MLRLLLWCLCIGLPALADGSQGFDASGTSSASIQRIQMLHDLPADPESSRLRCQRIDRAVEQLNSVLNRSLQARQLEKSTSMMHPEQTTLRTLLLEAHDAARLLSNDHVLILKLDDLPEQWNCDPALTALALRTLAVNAVRYTPAGTRITILGYGDARGLYLEVEDDGPGVSTEDLPHLFERYFRGATRSASRAPAWACRWRAE